MTGGASENAKHKLFPAKLLCVSFINILHVYVTVILALAYDIIWMRMCNGCIIQCDVWIFIREILFIHSHHILNWDCNRTYLNGPWKHITSKYKHWIIYFLTSLAYTTVLIHGIIESTEKQKPNPTRGNGMEINQRARKKKKNLRKNRPTTIQNEE